MAGKKIVISLLIVLLFLGSSMIMHSSKAQSEVTIGISPIETTVDQGELFNVSIYVQNIPQSANLVGTELRVTWNSSLLAGVNMTEVLYTSNTPAGEEDNIWKIRHVVAADRIDYAYSYLDVNRAVTGGYAPISGSHTVAIITFNATVPTGRTTLHFSKILLGDVDGEPIIWVDATHNINPLNCVIVDGSVNIGNPPPEITVLSPQNVTYSQKNVDLTLRFSEATSWIGYSLDGQANRTASGNITIPQDILSDGNHDLQVYANDTTGNMGFSEKVYFTIDATPPAAHFTYSPANPEAKMILGTYKWETQFNASTSFDTVTRITSYSWDFGDGFNGTGLAINHTYRAKGTYNMTLTVKDVANHTDTASVTLTLVEPPPEIIPASLTWWIVAIIAIPAAWIAAVALYIRIKTRRKVNPRKKLNP